MTSLKQKRFVDTDYFHEQLDSTTVEVEGSHISATETKIGYTTDLEILGNTVQNAEDLADIRSVGEQIDGQELYEIPVVSCGKNLLDSELMLGILNSNGTWYDDNSSVCSKEFIEINPNFKYALTRFDGIKGLQVAVYDANKEFINRQSNSTANTWVYTFDENAKYIKPIFLNTRDISIRVQLEEGTVVTEYEEYKEDKLTILSPTPLEKVGDVADRLICKDGVWGVEKNIATLLSTSTSIKWRLGTWNTDQTYTIVCYPPNYPKLSDNVNVISTRFKGVPRFSINNTTTDEYITTSGGLELFFNVNRSKLSSIDQDGVDQFIRENEFMIKYHITPQFIPLPKEQQIKLRTYLGTTNISFLTEIEGTIKCKVPKSVGGTLESLVEKAKITDDRIEILENVSERNNMEYSTDNGIVHCKNTIKGRVNNLAIEGNTMVNYCTDGSKTLTLNGDINEVGTQITTTNAVDNGLVDVMLEGNTMVNVCDQKDPVAITKSYTVESGNHVPLQGEYDGKCRPVVYGNTLVNLAPNGVALCNDVNDFKHNFGYIDMIQHDNCIEFKANSEGYLIAGYDNRDNNMLKLNTKYLAVADIEIVNIDAEYMFIEIPGYPKERNFLYSGRGLMGCVFTSWSDDILTGNHGWVSFRPHSSKESAGNSFKLYNFNLIELTDEEYSKPLNDLINKYSFKFSGIQSSFEDKVVTQEMVDSGKELAENLGKYKVDYKVTGKNKINKPSNTSLVTDVGDKYVSSDGDTRDYVTLKIQSWGIPFESSTVRWTEIVVNKPSSTGRYSKKFTKTENDTYLRFANNGLNKEFSMYWDISHLKNGDYIFSFELLNLTVGALEFRNFQIEEGEVATDYEPYKESIKTYYLNSPLLEGDTIEESGGNVVHVHRYIKSVLDGNTSLGYATEVSGDVQCVYTTTPLSNIETLMCDKFQVLPQKFNTYSDINCVIKGSNTIILSLKNSLLSSQDKQGVSQWLSENPVTVVYQLASPEYELISQNDSILQDSYVNGHLDFDTAVPVEKVAFKKYTAELKYIYPSTQYNIQFEADNVGECNIYIGQVTSNNFNINKGINKFTITTNSTTDNWWSIYGIGFSASNIVVTEATDKDFGYFSGMKSVGELEENKIEILSKGKLPNYTVNLEYGNRVNYNFDSNLSTQIIKNISDKNIAILIFDSNGNWLRDEGLFPNHTYTVLDSEVVNIISLYTVEGWEYKEYDLNKIIEITPYQQSNKKQIILNEPLRAVGDTKDRFVQIDGKWYIERNVGLLDCTKIDVWAKGGRGEFYRYGYLNDIKTEFTNDILNHCKFSCNTYPVGRVADESKGLKQVSIYNHGENAFGQIRIIEPSCSTANEFYTYMQNNPTYVTYPKNPTYEPVEVEPTLNTYVDVTHISNNSTIPCDMKVKNSGYSTIIKPSTLYTVALDTNNSGEVKVNLGGAEKTTTNNIVTLTTPSTLVDNELRISGKGLTSTNVRLLEGDKTNFIPSYFEGLKSSFDEKQGDNHIVEVISEGGEESNKLQFSTLAPLRSVGDISDKLVYKDNKWMIERNCGEINTQNLKVDYIFEANNTSLRNVKARLDIKLPIFNPSNNALSPNMISDNFITKNATLWSNIDEECVSLGTASELLIRVSRTKVGNTLDSFNEWLSKNSTTVVYQLAEPTYEEIGEYKNLDSYDEGTTIYANTHIAPKSLSFNLATHMSNIVRDVQDDVSDLKTWRSEVFDSITHKKTFEGGFTTVEDTKEGVIDEVKLEGKTLVNLMPTPCEFITNKYRAYTPNDLKNLNTESIYTLIIIDNNPNKLLGKAYLSEDTGIVSGLVTLHKCSKQGVGHPHVYSSDLSTPIPDGYMDNVKVILLEGDHTNNPPSFFEGLMSVGDGVEEISVESMKENLFDLSTIEPKMSDVSGQGGSRPDSYNLLKNGVTVTCSSNYKGVMFRVKLKKYTTYTISYNKENISRLLIKPITPDNIYQYNDTISSTTANTHTFTTINSNDYWFIFDNYETLGTWSVTDIMLVEGSTPKPYTPHKSDKKPLLYYNEETQTWEKPVLREWDSIEKHSDGKYYYHKRCEQIVLDGSEDWLYAQKEFYYRITNHKSNGYILSDKVPYDETNLSMAPNNHYAMKLGGSYGIIIRNDEISSISSFKQWLQSNPVTVVYEIAEEKVYEVANIELNSYDGETNVIVNSGSISPITTVSLTSNLPQVAENLRNRVRQLEDEVYNYKVVQNIRQLRTFYKSDYANFGIAVVTNSVALTSTEDITPYGYDLFELFKQIIEEGKDTYDRIELEEYIDFYVMTFIFNFDMAFELFDMIDSQHLDSDIEEDEEEEVEDSEIIEDEPIDPDFSVDYEEPIDPEFGVDYEEPTIDEDIDIEMGVIPDEDIDPEMGVIPNEPSEEEDNSNLEG